MATADIAEENKDNVATEAKEANDEIKETETEQVEKKDEQKQEEAPPMPQMKISQLLPMAVMFGLQKFNLEEMGYVRHAEAAYVIVQLLCLALLGLVYQRIQAEPDTGAKLKIPEVKQLGQVVKPAVVQTPKEYDMEKFSEQAKQLAMGACIMGGVYYKWGYLMPLVLQVFMTPVQLYESPLFQLHMMKATDITRPFPQPNPFGMPAAPEAPAEVVEDKAVKEKKDD